MGPYDSTLYRSDARPLCDGSVTWDSQLHRFTASPTAYRDGVLCRRPHWSGLGRHRQTPWALSRSTRTTSSMTWRSTRSSGRANNPERRRFKTAAVRLRLDCRRIGSLLEAAALCGMDRQTLRDWVHRFNAYGIEGLANKASPGRSPALSDKQMAELGPDPTVVSPAATLCQLRSSLVRISRSKRPYGFTCPQNRGVRACRSRGVRRPFQAGRARTCWTMRVFT
jgi:hypothetical protein